MAPNDEKTLVLGAEHDARLRRVVKDVLVRAGGKTRGHDWNVVGSQELETLEVDVGAERLTLEAETFIGLSLRGPPKLVDRIGAMVKAEMAKSRN